VAVGLGLAVRGHAGGTTNIVLTWSLPTNSVSGAALSQTVLLGCRVYYGFTPDLKNYVDLCPATNR